MEKRQIEKSASAHSFIILRESSMLKKLLLAVVALVASIGMAIAAVNINTATEAELDSLPGVGPTKAKAIVDYRKANGNFKSIDDIKNVKGIGDKTFDDLKGQIAVSGATTVPAAAPAKADAKVSKGEGKASSSAAKSEKKESAKASSAATSSAAKSEAKSSSAKSEKAEKADKASKKADEKPAK
ncbi:helix-hairpin-helix domain-containing protein [Uliginosibacterium sp. H3]|uniref:Helix-hairpin-helix domain-containing protein n=1 Tax=Uliginosibacterium silvisoli TaxID=3114758 RepID=A0ABU6K8D6_9RHOO|nr:helix-hairpin-helix domain-containing protein [Uliginosibacterium sp. H3]